MDPREIIVLSSGDEMSTEPYQIPSDESDGRNRAFPDPVDMSLGSDDLHGGKDFVFLEYSSFSYLVCYVHRKYDSSFVPQVMTNMRPFCIRAS